MQYDLQNLFPFATQLTQVIYYVRFLHKLYVRRKFKARMTFIYNINNKQSVKFNVLVVPNLIVQFIVPILVVLISFQVLHVFSLTHLNVFIFLHYHQTELLLFVLYVFKATLEFLNLRIAYFVLCVKSNSEGFLLIIQLSLKGFDRLLFRLNL